MLIFSREWYIIFVKENIAMNIKSSFIYDDFRISQESTDSGWTMPYSHYHDSLEIYILNSGERIVTIGDKEYIAKAHTASLFESNTPHRSRGDASFSGICIHFSERYIDRHFTSDVKRYLLECFRHGVVKINDDDYKIIKQIADEFTVGERDNFLKLAVVLNILNKSGFVSESKKKRKP